jgi:hypothetical protein
MKCKPTRFKNIVYTCISMRSVTNQMCSNALLPNTCLNELLTFYTLILDNGRQLQWIIMKYWLIKYSSMKKIRQNRIFVISPCSPIEPKFCILSHRNVFTKCTWQL